MKISIKYSGLFLLLIFAVIWAYYFYAVYNAKGYTNKIISQDLQESQWRRLNGMASKFEIRSHGLSKRQLEILLNVQDPGFYNHKGIEKLGESQLNYNQVPFLAERICGICGTAHSTGYCQAVEMASEIEVPIRARYIRSIIGEFERVHLCRHGVSENRLCGLLRKLQGIERPMV